MKNCNSYVLQEASSSGTQIAELDPVTFPAARSKMDPGGHV